MVWQAAGAIAAPIVGDILGGLFGNSAQKKANKANIQLQRENQAWMENMSNTSYQRGTKDLLAAGLNPMLAYSQGGASQPTSSAATVEPVNAMSRAVSSASSKAMQAASIALTTQQARKAKEEADQAGIVTDDMKNERGLTGGPAPYWTKKYDEADIARLQKEGMSIDLGRKKAEVALKEIEQALQEETFGYNVSSAATRTKLLEQEVSLNQIRMMLMRLDIPEKEAMAKWFESVGAASPLTKAVMSVGQWLKMILGR